MHKRDKNEKIVFAVIVDVLLLILLAIYVAALIINSQTSKNAHISASEIVALILFAIAIIYSTIYLAVYKENKQQKTNLKNANISLATSQAKIHWLANVVDALVEYSSEYPPIYNKLIALSRYLRTNESVQNSSIRCIPITKEIENIQNYIELEKMMVPEFDIEYYIFDEDIAIPLYTVQTLVDNSIKHGLKAKEDEQRFIIIKTYRESNYHYIEVTDNGVGFDTKTIYDETHTGIKNIKYRLDEILNAKLEIKSVIGFGTQVTIKIPVKQQRKKGWLNYACSIGR